MSHKFMRRALELAQKGEGKVSPNPLVGAVLVYNNEVLVEGYHRGFGLLHAEAAVMKRFAVLCRQKKWGAKAARSVLRGATLYVTLEPCVAFEGKKTPPCAPLLAEVGVGKVVIASQDVCGPVRGKGVRFLRSAGVKVEMGIFKKEEERMNEVYRKNMLEGLPFVAVKMGMTLDGRIATAGGDSRWITSERSRREVHRLRGLYDAVLTTSATVLADDPHLGVRMVQGRDPLRVVIDRRGTVPAGAKVLRDGNVLVILGGVSVRQALKKLFARGVRSVLVEAGGTFCAELLKQKLVDRVFFFVAPALLGGEGRAAVGDLGITKIGDMVRLKEVEWKEISDRKKGGGGGIGGRIVVGDFLITGKPDWLV